LHHSIVAEMNRNKAITAFFVSSVIFGVQIGTAFGQSEDRLTFRSIAFDSRSYEICDAAILSIADPEATSGFIDAIITSSFGQTLITLREESPGNYETDILIEDENSSCFIDAGISHDNFLQVKKGERISAEYGDISANAAIAPALFLDVSTMSSFESSGLPDTSARWDIDEVVADIEVYLESAGGPFTLELDWGDGISERLASFTASGVMLEFRDKTYNSDFAGTHRTVAATLSAADGRELIRSNAESVEVLKHETITYLTLETETSSGETQYFAKVLLVDNDMDSAVPGQTISFLGDDLSGNTRVTNSRGEARIPIPITSSGTKTVVAGFAGSMIYEPVNSLPLTFEALGQEPEETLETELTLDNGIYNGNERTITVRGTLADSEENPVSRAEVQLFYGNSILGSDLTESDGTFEITMRSPVEEGSILLQTRFAGNTQYLSSEGEVEISISPAPPKEPEDPGFPWWIIIPITIIPPIPLILHYIPKPFREPQMPRDVPSEPRPPEISIGFAAEVRGGNIIDVK
jgi:hypothetical protein